jgi:phospholipid/cholesterol/gamma-HCH transport system substrate-binding protein
MSPYRRNILVGVTVIGALFAIGWMILKFGDRPARFFATPSQPVFFTAERADGLGEGSNIQYRGVTVGKVKTVTRTEDGTLVNITAEVDKAPPLPANVEGVIRQLGQLGPTSNMNLVLTGAKPQGHLAPGAKLRARYEGLSLFPPEATALAEELTKTARQLRESNVIGNLNEQITRAGKTLDSANALIGDPKFRADVHTTLANIRQASESINRLGPKIEKLSDEASATMGDVRTTVKSANTNLDNVGKQIGDRLTQIAATLEHFQSIAAKIDKGEGTAGQLVNDPKLYQSLVESSTQLNATITDLKRLVEQWEQEGISFKLAK